MNYIQDGPIEDSYKCDFLQRRVATDGQWSLFEGHRERKQISESGGNKSDITTFIGWFIWSLFTWQYGQTPAKRLMKQVVVDSRTGEPFTWIRMLLREAAVKWAAGGIASGASNGITFVIDSLFVFRDDRKTVHDMIVQSKVIQL